MTDETLRASASLSAQRIQHGEDFQVRVTITNTSPRPVRLNELFMQYATLMLTIERADGSVVEPGPPPLPPRDDGRVARVELAPGAAHELLYHGGNYSPQRLPPGEYRVRFSHENADDHHGDWTGAMASQWLPLTVLE